MAAIAFGGTVLMNASRSMIETTPSLGPNEVVDFLRRPETFFEKTDHVELIETHISWVFLTDRFAYKLKKPVHFEFVDFSTLASRREACQDEMRLNRRLAEDVYLNIVPVTVDRHKRLTLGGKGTPVDWVLKMRRLPAEKTLERLALENRLTSDQVDLVAATLAEFYIQAAPLIVLPDKYRAEIECHVRANAVELTRPEHGADATAVRRIHAAQLRYLRLQQALFDERVCDGRVIEGHGDLRPEHIYIVRNRPLVIDCVEFNVALRTLDVADDLSFLAMECDRIGAEAVGRRVVDIYRNRSGDSMPDSLLAFYMAYRACVRAKVAALRTRQLPAAERGAAARLVTQYLALADGYARRLGRSLVLVVHGLMGTGKSTLAAALGNTLSLETLSTDAIRRELLPMSAHTVGYNMGNYAPELRRRVYEELLTRARQRVDQGASLVIDGAFLTQELRRAAVELARHAGAVPLLVRCRCDASVAQARIAARLAAGNSLSKARPDLFSPQEREDELSSSDLPQLTLNTMTSLSEQTNTVVQRLAIEVARATS